MEPDRKPARIVLMEQGDVIWLPVTVAVHPPTGTLYLVPGSQRNEKPIKANLLTKTGTTLTV